MISIISFDTLNSYLADHKKTVTIFNPWKMGNGKKQKIIAKDKNPKQDPDEVIYTKAPKPLSFIVARFLLKATEEASVTKENTNKAFEKNDTKGVPGAKVDANIDKPPVNLNYLLMIFSEKK